MGCGRAWSLDFRRSRGRSGRCRILRNRPRSGWPPRPPWRGRWRQSDSPIGWLDGRPRADRRLWRHHGHALAQLGLADCGQEQTRSRLLCDPGFDRRVGRWPHQLRHDVGVEQDHGEGSVEARRFAHRFAPRDVEFGAAKRRKTPADGARQIPRGHRLLIESGTQDVACLFFHRVTMLCCPYTQPAFQRVIEVAYRDTGHMNSSSYRNTVKR